MSQASITNGTPGKSRIQRRKSKPKIQGIPRPSVTNNGWKPNGAKHSWQRLKTAPKTPKATEKESVDFVDELGVRNESDLQLVTFDTEENDVKDDDNKSVTKSNDKILQSQQSTESSNDNNATQEKSKLENGNIARDFKKEKSTLHLPRAPSSKKDRGGGGEGMTDPNNDSEKGILPRRDSTKLSLDATSRVSVDAAVQNTTSVVYPQEEKKKSVFSNNDSWIRSAIPCLPLCLAVVCLIMNIIVPGSGTVLSGLSILCCGQTRIATKDDQIMGTLCTNLWVGFAQLFTVSFMFVGWFWSLAWGLKMVSLAVEFRQQRKEEREIKLQSMALRAFGSPLHVRPFTMTAH